MSNNEDMYVKNCLDCPFYRFKGKQCGLEVDEQTLKEYPDLIIEFGHDVRTLVARNCPLKQDCYRIHYSGARY